MSCHLYAAGASLSWVYFVTLRIAGLTFGLASYALCGPANECPVVQERGGWSLGRTKATWQIPQQIVSARAIGRATENPPDNPIDRAIAKRLAATQVWPAPQSTDEMFLRRVSLDLTGRLPKPSTIRDFLKDERQDKRERLVDELVASPEFVDRWTFWLTGWLRYEEGYQRDQYGLFRQLRKSVAEDVPISDLAKQLIGAGSPAVTEEFQRGTFLSSMLTTGGPQSDTADNMLAKTVTVFLGMGHYDCLLCHSGRGHLEQVNAWASRVSRREANEMAAYFGKTLPVPAHFTSYGISLEEYLPGYPTASTWGNRPKRQALPGDPETIAPRYRTEQDEEAGTSSMGGIALRRRFAERLVADPMFARNVVNRLWRELFGRALAEPFDGLDPARLDPKVAPPEGWTYQASHPELLEELAEQFVADGFRLRPVIRRLAKTAAYQRSSWYEGEWKSEYLPLIARHLPRRLEAEEIHDAMHQALGIEQPYTVLILGQVRNAMQFPDATEPVTSPETKRFLEKLGRSSRGAIFRPLTGSIPMALSMATDDLVLEKATVAKSPELARVSRLSNAEQMVEELYLLFLSRMPTVGEREIALAAFAEAGSRAEAVEDLAWALLNSPQFVFSE